MMDNSWFLFHQFQITFGCRLRDHIQRALFHCEKLKREPHSSPFAQAFELVEQTLKTVIADFPQGTVGDGLKVFLRRNFLEKRSWYNYDLILSKEFSCNFVSVCVDYKCTHKTFFEDKIFVCCFSFVK